MTTYYAKTGDTVADVAAVLVDADTDGPMNLEGATVVLRASRSRPPRMFTGAAVVVDPVAGSVRYDLTAADTSSAGWYAIEWVVTKDGETQTVPNVDYDVLLISNSLPTP